MYSEAQLAQMFRYHPPKTSDRLNAHEAVNRLCERYALVIINENSGLEDLIEGYHTLISGLLKVLPDEVNVQFSFWIRTAAEDCFAATCRRDLPTAIKDLQVARMLANQLICYAEVLPEVIK
jgi:hypothetical protein